MFLTACTASDGDTDASGTVPGAGETKLIEDYPDAITRDLQRQAEAPRPVAASAMPPRHLDVEAFPNALVDRERIVSGGPPPDGIPPIDDPRLEAVAEADWIDPDEAVLALEIDDEARAYPVRVMIWHEIVNDELGGIPVSVTYCPLCSSGIAFDRRLDGALLDFGTSGALYQANLVMYDRQTESLWTQFDGRAVIGERIGQELERLPLATVAWADFARLHPAGTVVSQETGFDRPYGQNPYSSYEGRDEPVPGFFNGEADSTLPAYERIIGLEVGNTAVAVLAGDVAVDGVIETVADGVPLTVWHVDGLASPLSGQEIGEGERIGATEVFEARVGGEVTSFRASGDDTFVDEATGSTWNILGEAVAGPSAGEQLTALPHVDTFWFSWATFHVDTTLIAK